MIYKNRKICFSLCVAGLALAAPGAGAATSLPTGAVRQPPPDVVRAGLSQKGESLILSVWTRRPVPLAAYDRKPRNGTNPRFLCFDLARQGNAVFPPDRGKAVGAGGGGGGNPRRL